MLYAAKCYWPGVTQTDVEQVAERAAATGLSAGRNPVAYLGSLLFTADDLVLCMFQGPSRAAVLQASGRLDIPSERLIDSTWLGSGRPARGGVLQMIKRLAGAITIVIMLVPLTAGSSQAGGGSSRTERKAR